MHNAEDKAVLATSGKKKHRLIVVTLAAVVCVMFAFGFVVSPLYKLICEAAGFQTVAGSVQQSASNTPAVTDDGRHITVKFDATVNADLPWKFRPLERSVIVQPGRITQAKFEARNLAEESVTGQAIPNIVPWQAAGYFTKTECFCFNKQELGPGESKEMVVQFMVSPDLPADISTLTLSYTFMNLDPEAAKKMRNTAARYATNVKGPG
jgi:cytochrome c oxidase assembly protein subunit 11